MGIIVLKFTPEELKSPLAQTTKILSTTEGFCEAFSQNLTISRTFTEAYEITESAHEDLFGRRRFSEYSHFCRARRNVLHKKK